MHDHELALCHDQSRLVLQCGWDTLDQIDETVAPGWDVGAILDVVRRPEAPRGLVVPLVEERIESSEDQRLVRLLDGLRHPMSFVPWSWTAVAPPSAASVAPVINAA